MGYVKWENLVPARFTFIYPYKTGRKLNVLTKLGATLMGSTRLLGVTCTGWELHYFCPQLLGVTLVCAASVPSCLNIIAEALLIAAWLTLSTGSDLSVICGVQMAHKMQLFLNHLYGNKKLGKV